MTTHLIPTPEAFAEYVAAEFGPDAQLHPANRLTSCGRRMGNLSTTTIQSRVSCKTCEHANA